MPTHAALPSRAESLCSAKRTALPHLVLDSGSKVVVDQLSNKVRRPFNFRASLTSGVLLRVPRLFIQSLCLLF